MALEDGVGPSHDRGVCRVLLYDMPWHETDHRSNKGDKTILQRQQEILARLVDFSTLISTTTEGEITRVLAISYDCDIPKHAYGRLCLKTLQTPGELAGLWESRC